MPSVLRLAGSSAIPASPGLSRRARSDSASLDDDLAAAGLGESVDALGDLGDAGTDQPVETEDLTGPQLQADVVEGPGPRE